MEEENMKKIAKVLSATLAFTLFLSACNTSNTSKTDSDGTNGTTEVSDNTDTDSTTVADGTSDTEGEGDEEFDGPVHQDPKVYTYTEAWAAGPMKTWSPHSWEQNTDSGMMEYIDTGLVSPIYDEETDNYKWFFEAATDIKDVTADFKDKEKYNVPADASEQYVYEITLNPDVKWEDGTVINADSYIYSMQQLLNPEMKNYRSNSYISGGAMAIANGAGYYNNDKVGQPLYTDALDEDGKDTSEGKTLFFSVDQPVYFFGASSATDYYKNGYAESFKVGDVDLYEKYKEKGYVEVTDEVKADILALAKAFEDENEEAWKEFVVYEDGTFEETPWEDVGIIKTGDYSFQYVLETPLSEFYFFSNMGSATWLVHEELYEKGKEKIENLVATNYFTDKDTTLSYGPYRLASYEKDRQIVLERNPEWHGYKDEKYDGQWQADNIRIEIISDHNTRVQMFLQGNLDYVGLQSADLERYKMSNYLLTTDETYTYRWVFSTDKEALVKREQEAGDGSNKQVLQYLDFRKALSLAINRDRYTQEGTASFKPAYFLFNYLYYYDMENDPESFYRKSDAGMKAILDLYEIEYDENSDIQALFDSVTGYDLDQAKELFQSVYDTAVKEKTYTDGQDIKINVMATGADSLSPDLTKQQDLINEFIDDATKGTGFEGKISVNFQFGAKDRYGDVARGSIDSIIGAWGGAAFYPFSTIRVYTEPDYMGGLENIHESSGWDPTKAKLKITYDFDGTGTPKEVEDTFQNWAKSINGEGKYANDAEARLAIMAGLERGVLAAYQTIPLSTSTAAALYSMRLEYVTLNYNIMYGYGGLRLARFTQDDTEWKQFIAEQGGSLNYE